ncbi:exosortase F system-associated membrane protein [Flavobacterium sp.]|uniref:exosortase F system-associated membrane protein n=1 Tax=Flavobacterium sp. TaxID=239 RepID=UPI003FA58E2B
MLKRLFKQKFRILFFIIALLGLVLVRAFENKLFYDPFLTFFKLDYQNKPLPSFDNIPLFFGLLMRYSLNTILSLIIIYTLFKQLQLVRFALILHGVFFVLLVVVFFTLLNFSNQPDYLILFYIRRFLIQPLFLLLFVPAFYYQQLSR